MASGRDIGAGRIERRCGPSCGLDPVALERAAGDLLRALGADLDDEAIRETPRRAAAYRELLTPEQLDAKSFPNDGAHDELVLVRDSTFQSLCEHLRSSGRHPR